MPTWLLSLLDFFRWAVIALAPPIIPFLGNPLEAPYFSTAALLQEGLFALLLGCTFYQIYWHKTNKGLEAENRFLKDSLQAIEKDLNRYARWLKSYGDAQTLFEEIDNHKADLTQNLFHEYGMKGATDRITTYILDEKASVFSVLARYSPNPKLCERGRGAYPLNEGFIGAAFQSKAGAFKLHKLPDPDKNPHQYKQKVQQACEDHKCSLPDLDQIRMKSRSYYCKCLELGGKWQVVIVAESREPKSIVPKATPKQRDLLQGEERLKNFVRFMHPRLQDPDFAIQRKF